MTHVDTKQSGRSRLRNTHKPEGDNEVKAISRFEIYTLKQFFAGSFLEDDKSGGEEKEGDVHEVVSGDSFFNRSLPESPHVPCFANENEIS